jgi:hypothetical protein
MGERPVDQLLELPDVPLGLEHAYPVGLWSNIPV